MSQETENQSHTERLIEFANRLALRGPDLTLLRDYPKNEYPVLTECLEHVLQEGDAQRKLVLPDLSAYRNNAIGIFSDYSGEDSGTYFTYSVLVCGYGFISPFTDRVKRIRADYQLGEKEIAFKDFRMGQIQASLSEYLAAADTLPGFLCTVAVDKQIATLFGPQDRATPKKLAHLLDEVGLGGRKPRDAEKLLRVVHMTAFLAALLASDGQKIFWMTDNDAICANEEQHRSMMALFDRVLQIYTRPGRNYPLLGGALPFQPRNVEMNDLLSLPDVVAGSVAHYLAKSATQPKDEITVKLGAEKVLCFLAGDGIGLKKATIVIRLNAEGLIERGQLEVSLVNPPADATFIPIYD